MAYTPPDRHGLIFRLSGAYTPPSRHSLVFQLPPPIGGTNTAQGQSASAVGTVGNNAAVTTAQGQSAAAVGSVIVSGSAATAQGQSATGSAPAGVTGTADTSQGESADATGLVVVSSTAATSEGQSAAASGSVATTGTANTAQGQSAVASGLVTVSGSAATGQGQTVAGALINFQRRYWTSAEAALPWLQGDVSDLELRLPLHDGGQADLDCRIGADQAAPADLESRVPWSVPQARDVARGITISPAEPQDIAARLPWRAATPYSIERRLPWGAARHTDSDDRRLPYHAAPAHDTERRLPWQPGARRDLERRLPWERGTPLQTQRWLPWNAGQAVPWAVRPPEPPVVSPPVPGCYLVPDRHALLFSLGGRVVYSPPDRHALAFSLRCGRERRWDVRRTLRMTHTVTVVRWPDLLPLNTTGGSLSLDRNSWAWTAQIQFADAASLIAVEPTPTGLQQIKITLDGYEWILQVDGYTEDRQSGHRGGSVTATSAIAQLGQPYSPARAYINPEATTAQQLVINELGFTGISLDWRITDWSVPAGVYAYDQETPISSIIKIAGAAGAMVQSADDSASLIVAPRLPDAPWNFDALTPDFTLAGGSWLSMGKRWNAGAGYNGVYVSGQSQGVLVNVYRGGTAGSPYAQLIVDPLIVDTIPARSRGLVTIADSLPRHEIPVTLPLVPALSGPGLLRPGELGLIEDTTWGTYRAIVDSLQVSYSVGSGGVVSARQSASLWRCLP